MKLSLKKTTLFALSVLTLGTLGFVGYQVFNETIYDSPSDGLSIEDSTNIKYQKVSDNKYKITASITPSDATYKTLSWELYWKVSDSSFSTGKNVYDYVYIESISDDTLSIIVECLQAFGETIIVRATSIDNENAYAECELEYQRKVESVDAVLNGETSNGSLIRNNSLVKLEADVTYSEVYTINTIYDIEYSCLGASDYTVDTQAAQGTYYLSKATGYFQEIMNTSVAYNKNNLEDWLEENVDSFGTIRYSYPDEQGSTTWEDRREVTLDEYMAQLAKTSIRFKVTVGDFSDEILVKFDSATAVTSLILDYSSIEF